MSEAQVFSLPAIGDAMVEGEIVEWFVAIGDEVDLDQPICSIETDKSVVELTTPHRGTVLELGGAPGSVLAVGAPLLIVGEADASIPTASAADQPAHQEAPTVSATSGLALSPIVRRLATQHQIDLTQISGTGPGGRITRSDVEAAVATDSSPTASSSAVRAMPKVRKLAREQSIDLREIAGTGPGGSITASDIVRRPDGATVLQLPGRRQRLSPIRRAIGEHLGESARTIPQFTTMVEVDLTATLATRAALRERVEGPMPIDAVFTSLLIPVLRDHPLMNAAVDGDEIAYHDRFDIGIAVDTSDGLMVPVVRGANDMNVAQIGAEIGRLAETCRNRTVAPTDLTGATCTVNNVGAVGIVAGTPILPLGTSCIVAFGVSRPSVRLINGNPVEVPLMTISATFDHRAIDGGDAGRFLNQFKQHLEVPALGLLGV